MRLGATVAMAGAELVTRSGIHLPRMRDLDEKWVAKVPDGHRDSVRFILI